MDSTRLVVGSGSPYVGGGGGHPGSFLDLNWNGTPSHRRSSSFSIGGGTLTGSWSELGSVPIGMNRGEMGAGTLGINSIAEVMGGIQQHNTGLVPTGKPMANTLKTNMGANGFRAPTTRDILPVTLASIKKVSRAELHNYLREITEEYDTFYNSRLTKPQNMGNDRLSVASPSVQTSISNFSSALDSVGVSGGTALNRNMSSSNLSEAYNYGEPSAAEITPLSSIPSVFFETDFQLDNPRIFDLVSEKSSIIRDDDPSQQHQPRKALASNAILQEKLSWYIDTVELHLIQEISNASSSFFSALDDLRNINKDTVSVVDSIKQLRDDLDVVDQQRAVFGIKSLKLKQRRKNLDILNQALAQIQMILVQADAAEALYLDLQYDECLNVLDAEESFLAGEKTPNNEKWAKGWRFPLCDVRSIHGLSDLRESLRTLRTRVGEGYSKRFTEILVSDLRAHAETVPKEATLHRMGRVLDSARKGVISPKTDTHVVNMAYLEMGTELRRKLESSVQGLLRSNDIQGAFKAYRDIVVKEAKNIVRMHLPSSHSGSESVSSNMTGRSSSERSVSLATLLRAMTSDEFEGMLGDTYAGLSELFRRLSTQQKLLLDVTLSNVPMEAASSSYNTSIDLSDLLKSVIDTSQSRIVKILNVRREQTANLTNTQSLLNFYSLSGIFLTECEAICGEAGTALRACITGQIKQFLQNRHRERALILQQHMDKAQWREEEITPQFQQIVDNIVMSGQRDPEVWLNRLKQVISDEGVTAVGANGAGSASHLSANKVLPKNVFVGTDSFIVPSAAVAMVTELEEYQTLSVLLPHLAAETIAQTADLVRKFNTKTTQLILGAGATRSAGLRHITAKHLALASQGINIVQTLVVPYMKDCGRRHVPGTLSVLEEYDRVVKDLKSHMEEIHTKFVTLMSDKMNHHVSVIGKTDWEMPMNTPHKYMLDLVKDTTVLSKILNTILPKATYLVRLK